MAKRIDTLKKGAKVTLAFYYGGKPLNESAEFLEIIGEGEQRRAKFRSVYNSPKSSGESPRHYEWEAYRYHKRWAYGTGADRLSLVSVDAEEKQ